MTLEEYKKKKHELWEAGRALDDEYSRARFGIGRGSIVIGRSPTSMEFRIRVDVIVVGPKGVCHYSGPRVNKDGTMYKHGTIIGFGSDEAKLDEALSKAV